jgi:integrase
MHFRASSAPENPARGHSMTQDTSKPNRRRVAPAYLKRTGILGSDGTRGPDRAITYLWIDGQRRQVHLGLWRHPESRERFARVLGHYVRGEEHEALKAARRAPPKNDSVVTVEELVGQFLNHADAYYRRADGTPTGEHQNFVDAATPLLELYGTMPAEKFGCPELERVREHMTQTWRHAPRKNGQSRLSLTTVNDRVKRIRRVFRWGVPKRLVTAAVVADLCQLDGLKRGRCKDVTDPEKVEPVAWEHVEPILAFVPPTVRSMILLQWATGARPGEICALRPSDIVRTNDQIWEYRPRSHKTAHLGKERIIPVDEAAQQALRPFLDQVPHPPADEPLFSPARAMAERAAAKRASRRSKVPPSQAARAEAARERNPNRSASNSYDVNAYRLAIHYGVAAANAEAAKEAMLAVLRPVLARNVMARFECGIRSLPNRMNESAIRAAIAIACESTGTRLPKPISESVVKAATAAASIPYWGAHQIRHAFGFRMAPTIGIENLRAIMGHADIRTTMRYAKSDIQRAFEALSTATSAATQHPWKHDSRASTPHATELWTKSGL